MLNKAIVHRGLLQPHVDGRNSVRRVTHPDEYLGPSGWLFSECLRYNGRMIVVEVICYTLCLFIYFYVVPSFPPPLFWIDVWCSGHTVRGIENKVHTVEWAGAPYAAVSHA